MYINSVDYTCDIYSVDCWIPKTSWAAPLECQVMTGC